MANRWSVGAALAAALLAVAGCGTGDDGSSTTTTTSTSGAARLSDEQWADYETASKAFASSEDAAAKKLNDCPIGSVDEFATCAGPSLAAAGAAATELSSTLDSFAGSVSGTCESDLGALADSVTMYANVVTSIQDAVDNGNVSQLLEPKSSLQALDETLGQETLAFEEACAPA